jgi:hypothetical protein
VFALRLNREDSTKKSIDLIRRKFSIDGMWRDVGGRPPFRNHIGLSPETYRSPSALIGRRIGRRKRRGDTVFGRTLTPP